MFFFASFNFFVYGPLSLCHQDGILTVCLCDTSGETDIHVNDILVSEGLAECCTDDETSLRFQNSHRTAEVTKQKTNKQTKLINIE